MSKLKTTEELRVCNKQCDQCLFSLNKIVSDKRKAEILEKTYITGDYFVCHKASIVNQSVMCRGFYEANKGGHLLIKLGKMLNLIRFVDVMDILKNKINGTRGRR